MIAYKGPRIRLNKILYKAKTFLSKNGHLFVVLRISIIVLAR
jgi:hypothetical protein